MPVYSGTNYHPPISTDALIGAFNNSAGGDISVIAAVAGANIRIYKIYATIGGATSITFKNMQGGTTGPLVFGAAGSLFLDLDTNPLVTAAVNTAFIINSSGAVQVSGFVLY